jgi:hypothetical protein
MIGLVYQLELHYRYSTFAGVSEGVPLQAENQDQKIRPLEHPYYIYNIYSFFWS